MSIFGYIMLAIVIISILTSGVLWQIIGCAIWALVTYLVFRAVGIMRLTAKLHEMTDGLTIKIGKLEALLSGGKDKKDGNKSTPASTTWGARIAGMPPEFIEFLLQWASAPQTLTPADRKLASQEWVLHTPVMGQISDPVSCTRVDIEFEAGKQLTQAELVRMLGAGLLSIVVVQLPSRDQLQEILLEDQRKLAKTNALVARDEWAIEQSARLVGWAVLLAPWWFSVGAYGYLVWRTYTEAVEHGWRAPVDWGKHAGSLGDNITRLTRWLESLRTVPIARS